MGAPGAVAGAAAGGVARTAAGVAAGAAYIIFIDVCLLYHTFLRFTSLKHCNFPCAYFSGFAKKYKNGVNGNRKIKTSCWKPDFSKTPIFHTFFNDFSKLNFILTPRRNP